ncbi:hypothetical protein AAZX31_20G048200 [Glycine max]|uniref:CCHC-type domain-containing protein n=1 Tax=Glycine max TaxID=3847 RepID=I1NE34_SOYBN|nr:zinc finger CCHC domain-containing protein 7 isoform X1 [Glycine max]KAG4909383.1 hypothetical protein JHK87_055499 [Glycine soja]KAH1034687.1 hypothetical protein GYH30_054896 [Glycine max]KRG89904.1 hypothetical protein GLYMA_20G055200v4 [Glycine max]|eukprot:XP_006605629.1 zinc finger CCHC domain-containing protein 7 isoform X1 [Glycine max]
MGRKEKQNAKAIDEEHDVVNFNGASTPSLVFSSDDDEANQDLSLKIVEKAMRMRAAKHAPNDDVSSPFSQKSELAVPLNDVVSDLPSAIADSEVTEKKKTAKLKREAAGDQSVVIAEEQEMEETSNATENHEFVEGSPVLIGHNMVLRKLLRGPRYFDPPDSSWGACFNCGEDGHAAVNCSAAKRKKPCYVCGGLGHNARQCTKAQDCFICKKGGHRAKDCLEKHTSRSKSVAICLKCGNSGHDMFSCRNDYSPDDLKEIQCYVCKRVGHLCCVNTDDATPGEISCYKCGQLGHTGLACSRLRDEITSGATPSSCFKCGEEGHFARECTSSIKSGKRNWESSHTKDKRSQKENDYMGNRSASNDMVGARRKKRSPTEERGFSTPKKSKSRGGWTAEYPTEERGFTTPKKSKSRGGWTTEHPTEERGFTTPKKSKNRGGWTSEHPLEQKDYTTPKKSKSRGGWMSEHPEEFFPPMSSRSNGYRSLGTPSSRNNKIHSFGGGSHTPSYKSSKVWNDHAGTSMSQGSARSNHHRFSASRFGNSSSDGHGRNYNWW